MVNQTKTQDTPEAGVQQPEAAGGIRRSAKWHRRRRAIVDRSAGLIARRGYHATSTAELCEVNELGKGALYYYIGSKEQLLAAIHDRVMDDVMDGAARAAQAGGAPGEQLAMLGNELLDVITRHPDHVWVFLHEFPALTGTYATEFRARRREYEQQVEAVLRAGIESGEFRPLDPALTTRAWLGMYNYTYLWLKRDGALGADEIADSFSDIFLRGISTTSD